MCVSARMKDKKGYTKEVYISVREHAGKPTVRMRRLMHNFKKHVRKIRQVRKKKKVPSLWKKIKIYERPY